MNRQEKQENLWLGVAFLMMVILFISSSQTYEQQNQQSFLHAVLKAQPGKHFLTHFRLNYAGQMHDASRDYFHYVEFLIRKSAHFLSYFIMGLGLFNGLKRRLNHWLLASVICYFVATGYAALDEYHQMQTGGRTPLFQDVMLDSYGALTAIITVTVWQTINQLKKVRKNDK
ncbi:VanZ family protein [Weissella diestrammenae]|uniref:VanZ family protein n=1 Tax=Weissella diestrammenae TaxID=1162633 RepID=UPI003B8357B9